MYNVRMCSRIRKIKGNVMKAASTLLSRPMRFLQARLSSDTWHRYSDVGNKYLKVIREKERVTINQKHKKKVSRTKYRANCNIRIAIYAYEHDTLQSHRRGRHRAINVVHEPVTALSVVFVFFFYISEYLSAAMQMPVQHDVYENRACCRR